MKAAQLHAAEVVPVGTSPGAIIYVQYEGCDTEGSSGGLDRSFLFDGSTLVHDSYTRTQ